MRPIVRENKFIGGHIKMDDIKFTEAEIEHVTQTVDTIYDAGVEFKKSNRNFIKWMTTSSRSTFIVFPPNFL
jgi:hypothetical protein